MGIIAKLRNRVAEFLASATDDFWYSATGATTTAGVSVTEETALTFAAVFCASRILSEGTAQLPLKLYRKLPSGSRMEVANHPAAMTIATCNPQTTPMAFREGRTLHVVNNGNGYAEIERVGSVPVRLWPIHPTRVKYELNDKRELTYNVRNNNGTWTVIPAADILHITGTLSEDGIGGKGIVQQARESIGYGMATEKQGSSMMAAPVPAYAITGPKFTDTKSRKEFREDWKQIHKNRDQPALLPLGYDIKALSLSAADLEFLGVRKFNIQEIARWYRLPPHMLADLSGATYNNVEMSGIEFVVYTLIPWLMRWEQALGAKLLTEQERADGYYFEHNVNGLLRGDTAARFQAYKEAIQNGWLSPNDVRRLENLNPVPGGDSYYMQSQMTTLENIAAGKNLKTTNEPQRMQADEPDLLPHVNKLGRMTRNGLLGLAAKIDGISDELAELRERREGPQVVLQQLPAPEHNGHAAQLESVKLATRKAFEDRLSVLVARECNEVRRAFMTAAGVHRPLPQASSRLEKFYAKHETYMAAELSVVAEACNAAGWKIDSAQVAAKHIEQSREALVTHAADGKDAVDLLSDWKENRVGGFCEVIFQGASNGKT